MNYDPFDSSGTDDDLPPPHQNRGSRGGRVAGNGRPPAIGSMPYSRTYAETDMEAQIHQLEQEAYSSVLRAFKAQADAITWEKESLITELRKELRLSNEEHRELSTRVNSDDLIRKIREWRQAGGFQANMLAPAQPVHDPVPSPTVSASRKKPKTNQGRPSRSFGEPSPPLPSQPVAASSQPSSSAAKRGSIMGDRGRKNKSALPPGPSTRMQQHPGSGPAGRGQLGSRGSSGVPATEAVDGSSLSLLVGRKVRTRWPDDNNFYEAVITEYNATEGIHALVYDMGTAHETWEWVDLAEISPEDIQWVGEDPGISRQGVYGGSGNAIGRPVERGPGGALRGRGRGISKGQSRKNLLPPQNGTGKKGSDEIRIRNTDILIKEVERVFDASQPDPVEVEKAKKMLEEQEQALTDAIARLADISDDDSD